MIKVKIKPLSVNQAWRGRRFKTPEHKAYREALRYLLPKINPPEGLKTLYVTFYFSSRASDIDNALKTFIDALQDKYQFDDKEIYKIVAEKEIVKKGEEAIKFKLASYTP